MTASPSPPDAGLLTLRALNRALLARQGLLDRLEVSLVDAVEQIGALQAQYWPSLPVALWSRLRDFSIEDFHRALEARELVIGNLLRGTIHMVSAREHPSYAVVAEESPSGWRQLVGECPADIESLHSQLVAHLDGAPRTTKELGAFVDAWLARHAAGIDEARLAPLRDGSWRRFRGSSALARVSASGAWGERAPDAYVAAPRSGPAPAREEALTAVARCHLRAFGPAAVEDVASWTGVQRVPLVRAALDRLAPELVRFRDEAGRELFDLIDAPRPDPEVSSSVRLLPWFDSALLAYAPRRRGRILPDAYRQAIYVSANLQMLPTFLVDGQVAGTWSVAVRRGAATLSLRPFARLARPLRGALLQEAEHLARLTRPAARAHAAELVDA